MVVPSLEATSRFQASKVQFNAVVTLPGSGVAAMLPARSYCGVAIPVAAVTSLAVFVSCPKMDLSPYRPPYW